MIQMTVYDVNRVAHGDECTKHTLGSQLYSAFHHLLSIRALWPAGK